MTKYNREYSDTFFRMLFRDPARFCELYRALGGKISEESSVYDVTLKDVFHRNLRNDLAFSVDERLVVFMEHQSTVSPVMPIRMLFYAFSTLFQSVEKELLYGRSAISVKGFEFYVLYHGREDVPKVYRLSDIMPLYRCFDGSFFLDCNVNVINIKMSNQDPSLSKSENLYGYSLLHYYVGLGVESGLSMGDAIDDAVRRCIRERVLKDFLEKYAVEVKKTMFLEYDYDTDIRVNRREAFEDGIREGKLEGKLEGKMEERVSIAKKLVLDGMSYERVAELTGLGSDEIEMLM